MTYKKHEIDRMVQIILICVTGIVLGFLVITQARYFRTYVDTVGRDSGENIFREIQIIKNGNDELKEEIASLENQLEEVSTQANALSSVEKEIEKNSILAGDTDIYGPGIILEIDKDIEGIWFTDIVNELFASGAEAVSINNIRLVESTIGFDTLPNGQIMVNGVILKSPFRFSAIGEKQELKSALESANGILDRMNSTIENFQYSFIEKDRIEMLKVN